MNEFDEIDGKLVIRCDHEFSVWNSGIPNDHYQYRKCTKCAQVEYLQPIQCLHGIDYVEYKDTNQHLSLGDWILGIMSISTLGMILYGICINFIST